MAFSWVFRFSQDCSALRILHYVLLCGRTTSPPPTQSKKDHSPTGSVSYFLKQGYFSSSPLSNCDGNVDLSPKERKKMGKKNHHHQQNQGLREIPFCNFISTNKPSTKKEKVKVYLHQVTLLWESHLCHQQTKQASSKTTTKVVIIEKPSPNRISQH